METQRHSHFGHKEYDDLIRPVMLISKLIAIWPLKNDRSYCAALFRICHVSFLFFMLVTMCAAITNDVIHNIDDLDKVTECAMFACIYYFSVIRITIFSLHQKDMLYVTETMRDDWIDSSYEERAILRNKCLFTFRLAKYFIIIVTALGIVFAFIPILETCFLSEAEKTLPFRGHFFVNQMVSPVYEYLYVFNTIGGWFSFSTTSGATSFNLVMITHGSAKFAMLQKRLETVNSNDPDVNRVIADCIRRHQDAITFADTLERIINILVLGQFVMSTALFCFAGFQVTAMMEDKERLMTYAIALNAAILELLMYSSSGNKLIDESDAVGESIYRSDWIGGTFGRSLQIIMMRSRIPSRITAAKFYNISLQSFSQVLSTSFSYMMVLMTMSED